ncbi:hypothetical protein D3C80_1276750 [compost metagenome]
MAKKQTMAASVVKTGRKKISNREEKTLTPATEVASNQKTETLALNVSLATETLIAEIEKISNQETEILALNVSLATEILIAEIEKISNQEIVTLALNASLVTETRIAEIEKISNQETEISVLNVSLVTETRIAETEKILNQETEILKERKVALKIARSKENISALKMPSKSILTTSTRRQRPMIPMAIKALLQSSKRHL